MLPLLPAEFAASFEAPPSESPKTACTRVCTHTHTHTEAWRTGLSHSSICHPQAWGVQCLREFRVAPGLSPHGYKCPKPQPTASVPPSPGVRKTAPLTHTPFRASPSFPQPPAQRCLRECALQSWSQKEGPGSHAWWEWGGRQGCWMGVGTARSHPEGSWEEPLVSSNPAARPFPLGPGAPNFHGGITPGSGAPWPALEPPQEKTVGGGRPCSL